MVRWGEVATLPDLRRKFGKVMAGRGWSGAMRGAESFCACRCVDSGGYCSGSTGLAESDQASDYCTSAVAKGDGSIRFTRCDAPFRDMMRCLIA
jgi:hypothetical protein